jgi:molybdenum cofactor cytidylyltransferase
MITSIILAAGLSQRFGSMKALTRINAKENVLQHLQNVLLRLPVINHIIIITGHNAEAIEPHILKHPAIHLVHNKDYIFGQTSSCQCALRQLDATAQGFFLVPVDFAWLTPEIFEHLLKKFAPEKPSILIPVFQGHKGHPPLFHRQFKDEILQLKSCEGINSIIHKNTGRIELLETGQERVVASFNTPEEFDHWQKKFS